MNSGFSGVADFSFKPSTTIEQHQYSDSGDMTDFVWAIRVSRIEKGVLDSNWSQQTHLKGATFDGGVPKADIPGLLSMDGLTNVEVVGGETDGAASFIFPDASVEVSPETGDGNV